MDIRRVTTAQPRHPEGTPSGGQWKERPRGESQGRLVDVDTVLSERVGLLARHGYAPPTSLPLSGVDGGSRRRWWDTHLLLGEWGDSRGEYPKMPETYRPAGSDGRRRANRRVYRGAGVTLRMPSATSVRAFAAGADGAAAGPVTFDVPVSVDHPGGEVEGWVRVTRGPDGRWATRPVGMSDSDGPYAAEAVQAVLEARRPSMTLGEIGDLLERRRLRKASVGVAPAPVGSSWISRMGFDPVSETMVLETATSRYGYRVPASVYRQVVDSSSPGRTFTAVVKGRAARVELSSCADCGRVVVRLPGRPAHRCPIREAARTR